jgi:hypothetical protein
MWAPQPVLDDVEEKKYRAILINSDQELQKKENIYFLQQTTTTLLGLSP